MATGGSTASTCMFGSRSYKLVILAGFQGLNGVSLTVKGPACRLHFGLPPTSLGLFEDQG